MVQSDFTLGSVILAEKTTNDEDIVIKLHNNKVHFYVTGSQNTCRTRCKQITIDNNNNIRNVQIL